LHLWHAYFYKLKYPMLPKRKFATFAVTAKGC
jgi:hypothetical protein